MLDNLYTEYTELLKAGLSADKALAQFDYLHPITLARLKKLIKLRKCSPNPQLILKPCV